MRRALMRPILSITIAFCTNCKCLTICMTEIGYFLSTLVEKERERYQILWCNVSIGAALYICWCDLIRLILWILSSCVLNNLRLQVKVCKGDLKNSIIYWNEPFLSVFLKLLCMYFLSDRQHSARFMMDPVFLLFFVLWVELLRAVSSTPSPFSLLYVIDLDCHLHSNVLEFSNDVKLFMETSLSCNDSYIIKNFGY